MIVCVTGTGPGLNAGHVPNGAFVVGVNRSYERVEPHVICTAEPLALLHMLRNRCPYPVLYRDLLGPSPWARNSGALALWYASLFEPDEIHVTGFGGYGHFYDDEAPGCQADTVDYYRDFNEMALSQMTSAVVLH